MAVQASDLPHGAPGVTLVTLMQGDADGHNFFEAFR